MKKILLVLSILILLSGLVYSSDCDYELADCVETCSSYDAYTYVENFEVIEDTRSQQTSDSVTMESGTCTRDFALEKDYICACYNYLTCNHDGIVDISEDCDGNTRQILCDNSPPEYGTQSCNDDCSWGSITGCESCNNPSDCDDGKYCTEDDCKEGYCEHTPIYCSPVANTDYPGCSRWNPCSELLICDHPEPDANCNPGDSETRGCPDGSSESRNCLQTCEWGTWSGCMGEPIPEFQNSGLIVAITIIGLMTTFLIRKQK